MEMKRKKKKGRPSKTSHLSAPTKPIIYDSTPLNNSRSTRGNPNFNNFNESNDEDEDDDERKEKKVKLVVRLPQSDDKSSQKNQPSALRHCSENNSGSAWGSDSDPDSEDLEACARKRKINDVDGGSNTAVSDQGRHWSLVPQHLCQTKSCWSSFLKGFKSLFFLCDYFSFLRFLMVNLVLFLFGFSMACFVSVGFLNDCKCRKDTHGAFSEPVDADELPDYHEIIKLPMDFGTVNKKLDGGAYKNLEELEADVLLICSNAMQYNSSDTIYYRQARSIQELAKRDFDNLKHEGDDGEPQPKIVRRGRPPGKSQKKSLEASPIDRVGPELSSGATLASAEDKAAGSNSYNLRKAPSLYRFRSTDPYVSSYHTRSGESFSEWLADWNDEFPASILRADMKYGKKQFTVNENRRDTYGLYHPLSHGIGPHVLSNSTGDVKQLVQVGLQEPFSYARSLARYAANLGPVAWKIASKNIESILPTGIRYGPGWVDENEAPLRPLLFSSEKQKSSNSSVGDCNSIKLATPLTSDLNSAVASEAMVEAVRKLSSQNELAPQCDASSWRTQFQAQPKPKCQLRRNGLNGMSGYDLLAGVSSLAGMPGHSGAEGVSHPQMVDTFSRNDLMSSHSLTTNRIIPEEAKLPESWSTSQGVVETWNFGKTAWQALPMHQRHNLSVTPDHLNARVPAVSPSSSLQLGSPQQPDLALQL